MVMLMIMTMVQTHYHKYETEFVDRVEYRLSFRRQEIERWYVLGEYHLRFRLHDMIALVIHQVMPMTSQLIQVLLPRSFKPRWKEGSSNLL